MPKSFVTNGEITQLTWLLLISWAMYVFSPPTIVFWGGLAPLALAGILGASLLKSVKSSSSDLLTPLFWFRVSSIVYFGVGASTIALGSDDVETAIRSFYNLSNEELARATLIGQVSISITLLFGTWISGSVQTDESRIDLPRRYLPIAFSFLIMGGIVRFALKTPYEMGMSEYTSGIFILAQLFPAGVLIILLMGSQRNRPVFWLAVAANAIDLATSLLLFNKNATLLSLLVFMLPFVLARPTLRRIGLCTVAVVVTLQIISPLVTFGREAIYYRHGDITRADIRERLAIFALFFSDHHVTSGPSQSAWALARLNYLPAQAFAIKEYDAGRPGTTLDNLMYVMMPRILDPTKPIISDVGRDFNVRVFGLSSSSTSPTIIVEGYFLSGWVGVFGWMAIYGSGLGILQRLCRRVIALRRVLFLPFVFAAMWVGLRPDGTLIVDFFGQLPLLIVLWTAAALAESIMPNNERISPEAARAGV